MVARPCVRGLLVWGVVFLAVASAMADEPEQGKGIVINNFVSIQSSPIPAVSIAVTPPTPAYVGQTPFSGPSPTIPRSH